MKSSSLDENIAKFNEETKAELLPELKPPYKTGERVPIKITRIEGYGAFADILDGKGYRGLIHIRNINGKYISDVSDYFEIGQELEAEVNQVTWEGHWKIELSTIHFFADNDPLAKLQLIKDQLPSKEEQETDKELQFMFDLIKDAVSSEPSSECKELLTKLIQEHGIAKITFAIAKASQNFQPDLSLYFLKEVERNVRDGL